MTSVHFLGKLLTSLVLITSTQYSFISAEPTHQVNEFTTESNIEVTEQNTEVTTEEMDAKLKLLKDLIDENPSADIFKDLVGASDDEFVIEDMSCYKGPCSFRVIHISKSFIIKHYNYNTVDATTRAKAVELEYKALVQRNQLQSGIVPQPYLLSLQHLCIVMEDSKNYMYLKSLLASGQIEDELLKNITVSIATLHNKTFGKIDTLGQDFISNALTEMLLKDKYVTTFSNSTIEQLTAAGVNLTAMEKLRAQEIIDKVSQFYTNIHVSANKQAVLHGFLTGDYVIIRGGDIMLWGNQFTFVGPVAFDVGTLEAQYLASYYEHMQQSKQKNDPESQFADKLVNVSNNVLNDYMAEMGPTVFDEEKSKEFVSAVAVVAGVELVSRIISQLVADPNTFTPTMVDIFEAGLRLIEKSDNINSTAFLVNTALNFTP